jgi:hypothetical protein
MTYEGTNMDRCNTDLEINNKTNNKKEKHTMNELEMKQTGTTLIEQSNSFQVITEQDYKNATEICKDIKIKIKQVEEYWKPLKEEAAKHHKSICAKEKELLSPYTTAEAGIKNKMVAWQRQKMEEERILKEEQERFKREEEARILALAVEAAEAGEEEHSEALVELAQEQKNLQFEAPKQVKVSGTAVKTIWKARVTNPDLVPVMSGSIVIRPIDTTALNKIATMVKGKSDIPGVEFYEDINISISRG